MSQVSGERYIRDFLRDFEQRAPQAAALLAFVAVAATAPSQAKASDLESLHGRYPLTRRVSAELVRGLIDPAGLHDPSRGECLGAVRPTGRPADALVFDRRLGLLSWVDDAGWPTYAPPDYREVPIAIIGGAAAPVAEGHGRDVFYAFAERQRPSVARRTLEMAERALTSEAIAHARPQASPFDACTAEDLGLAREERAATAAASRAVVMRATHEARRTIEQAHARHHAPAVTDEVVEVVETDAAPTPTQRATRAATAPVLDGARQAASDAIISTQDRVRETVYDAVSRVGQHAVEGVFRGHGPSADEETLDEAEQGESASGPSVTP